MKEIRSIHAFISEENGQERILTGRFPDGTTRPFLLIDWKDVHAVRDVARAVAKSLGTAVTLVRFSQREDLETYFDDAGKGA